MSPISSTLKLLHRSFNGRTTISPPSGDLAFGGRIADFSDPMTAAKVKVGKVSPYQPFLPNIWFSFAPSAQANLNIAKGEDGSRALFLSAEIGDSPWLSLECSLDAELIRRVGGVFALLEGSAAPRLAVRSCLRLPKPGFEGFVDSVPQTFALNSQTSRHQLCFPVAPGDIQPHKGFMDVRLIFFLPSRNVSLCLRKLTLAPFSIS